MMLIDIVFYTFFLLAALAAVGILITKNVIHAAFYLVVCLISLAGLYVLFDATYLAVVQLLVYAGGVIVLLAFGIMITNRSDGQLLSSSHLLLPGILAFGGVLVLFTIFTVKFSPGIPVNPDSDQVQQMGIVFMTDYLLAFELIAYLLLVVLVGASYLAKSSQS